MSRIPVADIARRYLKFIATKKKPCLCLLRPGKESVRCYILFFFNWIAF